MCASYKINVHSYVCQTLELKLNHKQDSLGRNTRPFI